MREELKAWLDQFPMSKVTELSHHQRKPNATVVLEICQTIGVKPSECAYVGDSIARDILMAKKAGVFSIWAKYGATSEENYRKLVRVSHWTSADVERERELNKQAMGIYPDLTLALSFREILTAVP